MKKPVQNVGGMGLCKALNTRVVILHVAAVTKNVIPLLEQHGQILITYCSRLFSAALRFPDLPGFAWIHVCFTSWFVAAGYWMPFGSAELHY